MNTLVTEIQIARARNVIVTGDSLTVDLTDGRTISVPLAWYPRLLHGKPDERNHWRLIGNGEGIHWPDLDEDLSVEGLVFGKPSGESQRSFQRWLEERTKRSKRSRVSKAKVAQGQQPVLKSKKRPTMRLQPTAPRRRQTRALSGSRLSGRGRGG